MLNRIPYELQHAVGTKAWQDQQSRLAELGTKVTQAGGVEAGSAVSFSSVLAEKPAAVQPASDTVEVSPEAAKTAFIEERKGKYAESADKIPVQDVYNVFGELRVTADERREQMGNPFVVEAKVKFDSVLSGFKGVQHQTDRIDEIEERIASENDPEKKENLNAELKLAEDSFDWRESWLVRGLSNLKSWSEQYGITQETEAFFADYTQFEKGTSLSLQKLYDMFDVA